MALALDVKLCDAETKTPLSVVNGLFIAHPGKKFEVHATCNTHPTSHGCTDYFASINVDGCQEVNHLMTVRIECKGYFADAFLYPFTFGFPSYAEPDDAPTEAAIASVGNIRVQLFRAAMCDPPYNAVKREPSGMAPPSLRPPNVVTATVPGTKKGAGRLVSTVPGEPVPFGTQAVRAVRFGPALADVTVRYSTAEALRADGVLDPINNAGHRIHFPGRQWGPAPVPAPRQSRERRPRPDDGEDDDTTVRIDLTFDDVAIVSADRKPKRPNVSIALE